MDYENDLKRLENIEKLRSMIDKSKTAMLTTYTIDGGFHSRPMGTAQLDADGSLWFFTKEFTSKVAEVSHDNKVNVTYSNAGANTYISINGIAQVVDDRVRMRDLWDPYIQSFFPEGLEDMNLTLLRVDATDAEFWDNSAGTLAIVFKWIQSKITGKEFEEGEHDKVQL